MTRFDFYILKNQNRSGRLLFACRLIEKAYQQGHKVYVQAENMTEAQQLNELLWTFNDISFVPHALIVGQDTGQEALSPILIGCSSIPANSHDILINLTLQSVSLWRQFQRIIEIIVDEEPWLKKGRAKFVDYRHQGCQIKTHEIKDLHHA